ncbi:MAG: dihydrofolate reductase [Candidatus Competibacteraceae bacterium]|nr:dihydrofolate reductase [Candidatus Competibacteraceae bacterium]
MNLSIILAATENGVIGHQNRLLWHLPDDLKFFKRITTGQTIIMGRKTWESIGAKPLPNRTNIVVSSNSNLPVPNHVLKCTSLQDAIAAATSSDEVFIAGGAELYKQALPWASKVYLTLVHTILDGDTTFLFDPDGEWELVHEEFHPADEKHMYSFTFQTYNRNNL